MIRMYLFTMIILLIFFCITCTKESTVEPPVPPLGSIYGSVIDDQTQLPIINALVVALTNQAADTTDSLGSFNLKGLSTGKETLQVTAQGYEPQSKIVEIKADSQRVNIFLNWLQANYTWSHIGLENKFIQRLRLFKPYLYACTSSDGLFRKDIQSVSSSWQYMGFPGNVSDVLVNQENPEEILIASQPRDASAHGVYKTTDGGSNWFVSDSGLGYTVPPYDDAIYAHPTTFCQTPYDLFAAGGRLVHTSNFGDTWENISGISGDINDFRYHKKYNNILWIGGRNVFGGPILYFSNDSGTTWDYDLLETLVNGDDAIFSIAFDPNDPNVVYASMFKRIIKTTDGGVSWSTIFSYTGLGLVLSIVEDDSQSGRLFAAAGYTTFETRDGGKNWFDLESPNGSGIVSMLYDLEEKALYIGTGSGPETPKGVFVYKKIN